MRMHSTQEKSSGEDGKSRLRSLKRVPFLALLSLATGASTVYLSVFKWTILIRIGLFLLILIAFILLIISVAVLAVSTTSILSKRRGVLHSFVPLLIIVFAVGGAFIVQQTNLPTFADFLIKLSQRQKVVSLILSNKMRPNESYNPNAFSLPKQFKDLSNDGLISIFSSKGVRMIVFFVYSGVNDWNGYMYRSDDNSPLRSITAEGRIDSAQEIQAHWYWVEAH